MISNRFCWRKTANSGPVESACGEVYDMLFWSVGVRGGQMGAAGRYLAVCVVPPPPPDQKLPPYP